MRTRSLVIALLFATALFAGRAFSSSEYTRAEHYDFFDSAGNLVGMWNKDCLNEIEYWGELWTGYDEYSVDDSCMPINEDPSCQWVVYIWQSYPKQLPDGTWGVAYKGSPTCVPLP